MGELIAHPKVNKTRSRVYQIRGLNQLKTIVFRAVKALVYVLDCIAYLVATTFGGCGNFFSIGKRIVIHGKGQWSPDYHCREWTN